MQSRTLGTLPVSPLGLGCMGMSEFYGPGDEQESLATIAAALDAAGVAHAVQSAGTMFSVFLTEGPVRDFAEASRTDAGAYAAFFHAMLDRGVYLPPSAYESWFLSAAHDDRAIQTVLDALPDAARAAAAAQDPAAGARA